MERSIAYVVFLKKRSPKSSEKYFAVTIVKRDEFNSSAVFHGVGYWTDNKPERNSIENKEITEVWIPWGEIDHVESWMYRQRS